MRCTPRSNSRTAGEEEIGTEDFARNLELQAQVDTYLVLLLFVAFFRRTQRVSRKKWIAAGCGFTFPRGNVRKAFADKNLRSRYLEVTELAAELHALPGYVERDAPPRRDSPIPLARECDAKKRRIFSLMDAPRKSS